MAVFGANAQTDSLLYHFGFLTTADDSGVYTGKLCQGATLHDYNDQHVLDLGSDNGYFDFGEEFGKVIGSLSGNYTIAVNVFVPEDADISHNGNFIWCFARSSSEGYMFLNAKDSRFAITLTDYEGEVGVTARNPLKQGQWNSFVLVHSGNTVRLYVNGVSASKSVRVHPADIGSTTQNYIGRSCYEGDAYLRDVLVHDFRVYNYSLPSGQIVAYSQTIKSLNAYADSLRFDAQMHEFTLGDVSQLKDDIELPTSYKEISISWSSSDNGVITADGHITRPVAGSDVAHAVLTAHMTAGENQSFDRDFEVGVLPELSDEETVAADLAALTIPGHPNNVYTSLTLPTVTENGSVLFWKSNDPEWMTDQGRVVKLPEGEKHHLTLTATVSKGKCKGTRDFDVTIHEREPYTNYLFVYFPSNSNENLYYALSNDGYNFTPMNNGYPVVTADTIAIKKGVRDPHLLRGPDGMFYMVNTDMRSAEGWSSNRGIVMMKSPDLIHWTHSTVHFPERFAGTNFANVTRVWAPETIWDEEAQKFMVYFSLLTNDRTIPYDKDFYCYANADFTDLEGEPTFFYDRGSATIDMDIVYNESDSLYHGFYKNEGEGGICKVTARYLTARPGEAPGSQWSVPTGTLQQTRENVEGAGVFKLINQDSWILMYDCYSNGHYQFCSSSDLENFTFVQNTQTSGIFTPRHGTVLPITEEETEALLKAFPLNSDATPKISGARNSHVKQTNVTISNPSSSSAEGTVYLPVDPSADLTSFDPEIIATAGGIVSPQGAQDFSQGSVVYTVSDPSNPDSPLTYNVKVEMVGNPIIPDFHADPEVLFSRKTGRFYVYPTTDGYASWGGYTFDVFSSPDLLNFTNEGTILNLKSGEDVAWASGNAWAPCIEEKFMNGKWRYFFYFSGQNTTLRKKTLGVAVSDSPTGPFKASSAPLFTSSSAGQMIDSDVFTDPVSGQTYFYYGNGGLCYRLLSDDMMSVRGNEYVITPKGGTLSDYAFREGAYVFYRNGLYYFLWSVDDTGSTNYHVAYGTSTSPTGPIEVATQPIVIIQNPSKRIYGTGHNSIVNIPETDDWYIVYHRINPNYLDNSPGVHREVCADRLTFNADGSIQRVTPTNKGIDPVVIENLEDLISGIEEVESNSTNEGSKAVSVTYFLPDGTSLGVNPPTRSGLYLRREVLENGQTRTLKILRR